MGTRLSLSFNIIFHPQLLVSVLEFPKRQRDEEETSGCIPEKLLLLNPAGPISGSVNLGGGVGHPSVSMFSSRGGEKIKDCRGILAYLQSRNGQGNGMGWG